jgi:hypothetical protein
MKGMAADTKISNVFYCKNDTLAFTRSEEKAACDFCGDSLDAIGWVEETSGKNEQIQNILVEKGILSTKEPSLTIHNPVNVDEIVSKVINSLQTADTGGQKMVDEKDDSAVESTEVDETGPELESQPMDEATEEDVVVADNTETEEVEKTVSLDEFSDKLVSQITASFSKAVAELKDADSSLEGSIQELQKGLEDLNGLKTQVAELGERLEGVENSGAVRKSAEDNTDEQKMEKSFWNGAFGLNPNV